MALRQALPKIAAPDGPTRKEVRPIRVLLADDHSLVRAGIRSMIEKFPRVEVVGEASNGREALELVRSKLPDLVLLDIAMPDLSGLEVLPQIVKNSPSVKVVVLSAYGTEQNVSRALRAGASGYILKYAEAGELGQAINSVAQGEIYLSPSISRANHQ
jgi:DNA-binding NarL/FixJ family response regulator